jgi:diguanylate cyclase (GGDEF)-like protein
MERAEAHQRAFALLEAVQGEDHLAAAREIDEALSAAPDWLEVRFVLHAARVVLAAVRPADDVDPLSLAESLLDRAAEPAQLGLALGLRALVHASLGDTAALLADTSRAVAYLDDDTLPAMERCLAWVICGAALNTLRLWELVDELYTRALALGPAATAAGQTAAVAVNRVLIRLEHGLALLERGDEPAARARLTEALDAVAPALAEDLRPLWRNNVLAVADLVRLLLGQPVCTPLDDHRVALSADGDLEVLPHLEAAMALSRWRAGDPACPELDRALSTSSGARSFPLWVRAQVLASGSPGPAVVAQRKHAELLGRLLWESRSAVLSAARAQLDVERRRAEHERLVQAVHTDPLTGLHNRRRFEDWLQGGSGGSTCGLLLLDLDAFKRVNDVYGHTVGDDVLRRVGLLLRAAVRPVDLALRQGGDEFAVVLNTDGLSPQAVLGRAEAIVRLVQAEDWGSVAPGLTLTVSVGAALGEAGPDLYRTADTALYTAKQGGSGPVLARPEALSRGDR